MEKIHLQQVLPADIEKRSFEIITEELLSRGKADAILPENELVVKRVIHTTADFDYVDNLCISEGAVQKGMQALKNGACIVTDTQMARSGINKKKLAQFGGEVFCFISDEDVAAQAKQQGTTRATASMEKAAKLDRPLIFAIGNAPTALVKLNELMEQGLRPELIIGVPVGFVNVVEAGADSARSGAVHRGTRQKGRQQRRRSHLQRHALSAVKQEAMRLIFRSQKMQTRKDSTVGWGLFLRHKYFIKV